MIEAIYAYGLDKASIYQSIREKVFNKKQQVPAVFEQGGQDEQALHVIVYQESCQAVATGRLLFQKNDVAELSQVAVLLAYRRKGYGSLVIQMLLTKAFDSGCQLVFLHTQVSMRSFYEKIGFKEQKDIFLRSDTEYIKMSIDKNTFFCRKDCCFKR